MLASGFTVMIAMAGMLLAGGHTFVSFSIATMIVVAVAMIGSLTVRPAVLSKLGDRVEKGRIPLLGRYRRSAGEGRVWSRVLTPVLRRPVVSVIAAAALLMAIAIPTLSLHTAQDGPKAFRMVGAEARRQRESMLGSGPSSADRRADGVDPQLPGFPAADNLPGLRLPPRAVIERAGVVERRSAVVDVAEDDRASAECQLAARTVR